MTDRMKPLTAEEIAELRRQQDMVVKGSVATFTADGTALLAHPDSLRVAFDALRALPRLLDEVERARALLKRIEWGGEAVSEGRCPACGEFDNEPHRPGCELAELIGP